MGPNYTANSGLISYFNFEDSSDALGGAAWTYFPGANPYGRANTSGISQGGSANMYNGGSDPTVKDFFSFVVWSSPYSEDQGVFNMTKYTSGNHLTNVADSEYSWGVYNDNIEGNSAQSGYMYTSFLQLVSGITYEFEEYQLSGIEVSRWNMYYFGVSGTTMEMSANGMPRHIFDSGNIVAEQNTGTWQMSKNGLHDELRIYDRILEDDELSYLYNHGFPQPLYRDSPKTQYLYPRTTETAAQASIYLTALAGDIADNFFYVQNDSNVTGDEFDFCHSCDNEFNARMPSCINGWHGPFPDKMHPADVESNTALMFSKNGIVSLEFDLGPLFVIPSY